MGSVSVSDIDSSASVCMPCKLLSGSATSTSDDRKAPHAAAMCWTAELSDMKRARSCGAGTSVMSVLIGTLRKPIAVKNRTKIAHTGRSGGALPNPAQMTATAIRQPNVATRNGP